MATITVWEMARSRSAVVDLRAGSTTFEYIVIAVPDDDDEEVDVALIDWFQDPDSMTVQGNNIETRYGFQLLRTIDVKPQGGDVWLATLTYGFDEGDPVDTPPGDPLPYEFSFDTTGGTQHITQSLATTQKVKYGVPPVAVAPINFSQAIGVSRSGVAGADVVAPKLEFQLVRNFQGMTLDYIRTLRSLTGTVNDAPFYGFEAGELLLLGGSGAPSQNNQAAADPLVRVTFRFGAAPNRTNIDLVPDDGSGNHLLRIPQKKGWEYLWVSYRDEKDSVSGYVFQRPDSAYVEQVYPTGDFTQLLIGS